MLSIMLAKETLQKQKSNKITHNIEEQIEYVSNENTEESVNQNIIENEIKEVSNNEIIGTLTIPDILLENAPIMEGTESSTLQQAIGHFESTSLFYGNVGLASHNSGGQGDYFKNLKNVNIGSFIYYQNDYGIRKYIVTFKKIISEDDFSYLKENSNNRITLITCTKDGKNKRLCVQGLEVQEGLKNE